MGMISLRPSVRRQSSRWTVALATGTLVAGTLAATASAGQAAVSEPLPPGASAGTPNIKHLANLPKPAPFAAETSFNSDLAFQGNFAYGGNYDGFVVYDIRNP